MSAFDPYPTADDPPRTELKRAAIATVLLAALFSLFAFAAPRDPTKVVPGIPCSLLSEEDIGTALGTPMRLMPTSGTVCQYVSTGGASRTLIVIARHDPTPPIAPEREGVAESGLGDAAMRTDAGLYVRYGAHSYMFEILPQARDTTPQLADEIHLARMAHPAMIARAH